LVYCLRQAHDLLLSELQSKKAVVTILQPNKPDAVNPAMTLWFAIEDQWRRVTDLERWPKSLR
jgi:putative heme degradation protein